MESNFYSSFSPSQLTKIIGEIFINFFLDYDYGLSWYYKYRKDHRLIGEGKLKEDLSKYKKGDFIQILVDKNTIYFINYEDKDDEEEMKILSSLIMYPEIPELKL